MSLPGELIAARSQGEAAGLVSWRGAGAGVRAVSAASAGDWAAGVGDNSGLAGTGAAAILVAALSTVAVAAVDAGPAAAGVSASLPRGHPVLGAPCGPPTRAPPSEPCMC